MPGHWMSKLAAAMGFWLALVGPSRHLVRSSPDACLVQKHHMQSSSAGYNLKVGVGIEMMKFDMGGSAAVLGAARALAVIQPEGVEVRRWSSCASVIAHFSAGALHARLFVRADPQLPRTDADWCLRLYSRRASLTLHS